ncbi:MAG: hypothetical protein IKA08_02375 [Alphaproteobacteria bacterium]|nr:hypothetical protein [Alphaproteobacteria bacterium]
MKNIKLSPFKRLLMFALVLISNVCMGTKISYGAYAIGLSDQSMYTVCASICAAVNAPNVVSGTSMLTWPNVSCGAVSFIQSACYCFSATEASMLTLARTGSVNLLVYCSNYALFSPVACLFSVTGNTPTITSCAAGKYLSGSACYNCPAGRYSAGGTVATCTVCPAGRYASTTGLSTCTTCPAGRYASTTGLSTCTACPAGRYASTTGLSTCAPCPGLPCMANVAGNTSLFSTCVFGILTATGANSITKCYAAAITTGQQIGTSMIFIGYTENGHMYDFAGSCMYQ